MVNCVGREHLEPESTGEGTALPVTESGTQGVPGISYSPPLDKVCPDCGAKHTGYFYQCSRCAGRASDEQHRLYF